jgi:transglutaminase-like putative cysteine protease
MEAMRQLLQSQSMETFMDRQKLAKFRIVICLLLMCLLLTSCGGGAVDSVKAALSGGKLTVKEDANAPNRDSTPKVLPNEAPGAATFGGEGATVDYSNAANGYVMVSYEGANPNVKVQITPAGQDTYTYDLQVNVGFQAFPLSMGAGTYDVGVFTNVEGDRYAQVAAQTIEANIADQFQPFLRANQYANFTAESQCVSKAQEVVKDAKTDLGATERIYQFVVSNVVYDFDKAATVQSGYIPNPDDTLATGKGICFDFASLTTSMLRSQGIPCKLVVGYAGSAYHAWISVYSKATGEVYAMIEFKSDDWNRMDPTFTASGDTADPNVVGDGSTYNPMYYY